MIQITLIDAIRFNTSNKEFCLYDLKDGLITNYRLTNNIDKWFKEFSHMIILKELKKDIQIISFNSYITVDNKIKYE